MTAINEEYRIFVEEGVGGAVAAFFSICILHVFNQNCQGVAFCQK